MFGHVDGLTRFINPLASLVKYGGKLSLAFNTCKGR